LEALIISLTKSSTHSAPSNERCADADRSSVGGASAPVVATPTTKIALSINTSSKPKQTSIPRPQLLKHKAKIIILLSLFF
jgi:hypothetical protein